MKIFVCISVFVLFLGFFGSVTIEGKISVKGNEPNVYLALTTKDNREYSIVGKYEKEIWEKYQGQSIRVKGRIVKKGIGPGFPDEFEVTGIMEKSNK
jgi:hypothetical protein